MTKEQCLQKARIIHKRFNKNPEIYVIDIYYALLQKYLLKEEFEKMLNKLPKF